MYWGLHKTVFDISSKIASKFWSLTLVQTVMTLAFLPQLSILKPMLARPDDFKSNVHEKLWQLTGSAMQDRITGKAAEGMHGSQSVFQDRYWLQDHGCQNHCLQLICYQRCIPTVDIILPDVVVILPSFSRSCCTGQREMSPQPCDRWVQILKPELLWQWAGRNRVLCLPPLWQISGMKGKLPSTGVAVVRNESDSNAHILFNTYFSSENPEMKGFAMCKET